MFYVLFFLIDEKWKIATIESLDILVWSSLKNCKFLESWTKMWHFIYWKELVVNTRHAYEYCEKKIVEKRKELKWMNNKLLKLRLFKRNLEKTIDFYPFWGK